MFLDENKDYSYIYTNLTIYEIFNINVELIYLSSTTWQSTLSYIGKIINN